VLGNEAIKKLKFHMQIVINLDEFFAFLT